MVIARRQGQMVPGNMGGEQEFGYWEKEDDAENRLPLAGRGREFLLLNGAAT